MERICRRSDGVSMRADPLWTVRLCRRPALPPRKIHGAFHPADNSVGFARCPWRQASIERSPCPGNAAIDWPCVVCTLYLQKVAIGAQHRCPHKE